jgi:benzil reductase ((S)-benzoin forming)
MTQRPSGKTTQAAIVTGVSRGLGEAIAAELLARGFVVLGVGRANSARLAGRHYQFVTCDLSIPGVAAAPLSPALRDLAGLQPRAVTLVNNAAVASPARVVGDLDAAEIESAIATNLTAPLVLADLFLRAFRDDAVERRVLNISSGAAQSAIPGSSVYCASKAGLEMATRALASENHGPRFRSIALRPGIFDTAMQAYMRAQDPASFPSAGLFRGFKEKQLLKHPAEVAARVVERLILAPVEHGHVYTHTDL